MPAAENRQFGGGSAHTFTHSFSHGFSHQGGHGDGHTERVWRTSSLVCGRTAVWFAAARDITSAAEIRPVFACNRPISISLGTADPGEARRLVRRLAARWDELLMLMLPKI